MFNWQILKRPLDTETSFATQHHEAKAQSRDKTSRGQTQTIATQRALKSISFIMVWNTLSLRCFFENIKMLTALWPQACFVKTSKSSKVNRQNRRRRMTKSNKYVNATAARITFWKMGFGGLIRLGVCAWYMDVKDDPKNKMLKNP